MKSTLVVLVAYLAYASAIKSEQPEERIFSSLIQSTDGYTHLGLNETYLWGAVGAAAVLGVVMLVMAASGVLPAAAQKPQRYSQEFSKNIFLDPEQEDVQYKYRRSIADNGKDAFNLNTICLKESNLLELMRLDTTDLIEVL